MTRRCKMLPVIVTPQCQRLLQYMTSIRHVAKLVEYVASGSSAHSRLQANENVLPAVCVVSNSALEKRVCNSGATESLTVISSSLSVSMGGIAHDQELLPKLPTDQDAVETVIRQRVCVIRAAADTEVSCPLPQTRKALRLDEEIWDFQWFDTVPWDNIKDLRGTAYVQPPPWFKFALQQAQHAILRAIMHHNPSLASEPACKALVVSSWLL